MTDTPNQTAAITLTPEEWKFLIALLDGDDPRRTLGEDEVCTAIMIEIKDQLERLPVMTDAPNQAAEFQAAPAELWPGLMAAAEWHESCVPFWDELIEKYRATGNLVAERGACAYRNSHSSSASILRGKAAGEIGL